MKTCTRCANVKPLDQFSKHPQTRDRRASSCKACDAERLRARAQEIKAEPKEVPAYKLCPSCQEVKPSDDFGKLIARKDGLSYECKPCLRKRSAAYRVANPEQVEKSRNRSRALYADQARYLDYLYRNKFGISLARYEEMLTEQGGGCAICSTKPAEGKPRLSVDHDHACCPGKRSCGRCVRGLLCSDCNFGLGKFRDEPDLLTKAASYLAA